MLPASTVDWLRGPRRPPRADQADAGAAPAATVSARPADEDENHARSVEDLARITSLMQSGQFDEALISADDLLRSPRAPVFEATSLAVDCCLHLGQPKAGLARISRLLDKTVPDAHTELRLGALTSRQTAGVGPFVAALNRIYMRSGLVPVLGGRSPSSWVEVSGSAPSFEPSDAAPLVSVIVPVNGVEPSIALRGLAAQSWTNLELIVVAVEPIHLPSGATLVVEPVPEKHIEAGRRQAAGTITLVHRADEWSHPQRVEMQVGTMPPFGNRLACAVHSVRLGSDLIPRPLGSEVGVELVGPNDESVARVASRLDASLIHVGSSVPMSIVFSDEPFRQPTRESP